METEEISFDGFTKDELIEMMKVFDKSIKRVHKQNTELKEVLKEISETCTTDHNAVVAVVMMAGDAYREL